MNEDSPAQKAIAVIGMAGRFPGAQNPDEFWENLMAGKDGITRFPARTEADGSKYVGARSMFENPDQFDASFFGIYPKEAEVMDPQHRVFLECSWEALEDAGYDPAAYPGMIGVYAGLSLNTYLLHNLGKGKDLAKNYQVAEYQTMLGNDKDFLPVRVSYKLNLRGPSMTIQSACSTSLVAICQAATALLTYQCDMALTGGVSISFPQQRDYLFQEEGMVSPDGTCRAFDADAAGTVFGHGCGVVLLKRLSEAIADRDPILAVIKGWAVNNDGSDKIGFAAPGLNAQADVIALAQAAAGVSPSEISYIEAHGTGTPLGDPIEIAALTKAFREGGAEENAYCAIGTGKTHIGHLDCAAGVTGVIKTIQQLRHEKIPALLHYKAPNPRIDFANSPFSPVSETRAWKRGESPRLAGVSAFGVGGTNAHVILEEAPQVLSTSTGKSRQLLLLSAKSTAALEAMSQRLADHLQKEQPTLADVSHTLATGRRAFPHRRAIVAADTAEAIAKLGDSSKSITAPTHSPKVAFLFPGQGSQYVEMGREIYDSEPTFRSAVDECAALLVPLLRHDIRSTLYPSEHERESASHEINRTALTQPCIFVIEYALAKLWISWGIQPSLLIGHSIGEYVAAVLAGTFKLENALHLLAKRASLMQDLPGGSMLAVRCGATELTLPDGIDLAAVNSPQLCTLSGSHEAILSFQKELEAKEIGCRLLKTSHAFHSAMMEPMLDTFTEEASMIPANAPKIPWISTCTGKEIDAATLADPGYWAHQLRHTVQFTDALATAFIEEDILMLEVGPGQALAPLARQHPNRGSTPVISTLPSSSDDFADLYQAAGELWKNGVAVDWMAFFKGQDRARLHLPTYPFERQSYWIDNSSEATVPVDTHPAQGFIPAVKTAPVTTAQSPAQASPDLAARLRAMVLDLSGIVVDDDSASFTELGFDSLFLTQASQAIHSKFGVKITFRQMLGDLSSVASLAKHLAAEMPASTLPVAVTAPATAPVGTPLEQLMANNLQLMQAMLSGQQPASSNGLSTVKWPDGHARNLHTNTRFGPYKPIDKGDKGGLTEVQQKSLDQWIARYVAKTPSSKAYTAEHRPHYADPRAVSGFKSLWKEMVYPIVSARSKDAKIWDIDHNEYVDITMGFGTYFFGHSPDWLIDAVEKQLRTGVEIGPQSPIAGKLAKAICELTGMERATFCNTGSEAVMAAMRLAHTITGRSRIAYFTGDYHGMFEEVLVRGAWVDGVYKAQPIAPGIPQSLVENMLVLDYADPASLEILRTHAHELAAVMIEPVQSRAPGIQPREFMHEVRAITQNAGAALIFDEVVTGFRCAPGGAQAFFGVEADMATYGKVIGGGMPIGVLAGKKEYMDALDGGAWSYGDDSFPEVGVTFFAGTFVRHPLALAAAWRVVEHLKGEGPRLQIDMEERVGRLCGTLNEHFKKIGVPIRLPHFSAYAVIEHAPDLKYAGLLWYLLREKGVHVWEGRPLYFTTAHTNEDLDKVVKAFTDSVTEMQAAGFLPASSDSLAIAPVAFPRFDSAPATEAQLEIFHAVQMGNDANCSFNESNVIHLEGVLDTQALKAALNDLVVRHPALRSTFSEDGRIQRFHPSARHVELMEHDFSSVSPNSPATLLPLSLIKSAESSIPFDLTNGPLFRLHLVRLSAERHELIFTAHHLVCDGWSFGMILSELASAYNARKAGLLPKMPTAMSFADFARLENLQSDDATAENFWVDKFATGAPVLELPTDRPRPQLKTYVGAMEAITLDSERYARLKKASPKLGGTLFATLLASFATLLHRITGQDDLVIGVPSAGQTRIGRDELVGHCLNFLPLRLQADGTRPFHAFAATVKEQVLEAYDHQNYTFGSLLQKITLPRDTSRLPLVTVMFNIDKSGIDHVHLDGLKIDASTNPKQFVNFDLFFNLVQTDERLIVECEYNTDLHDKATIRRWLSAFEQLIESAITCGDSTLDELPMLGSEHANLVLNEWNATTREYPRDRSTHQLISAVAALHPERGAVRCGDESLTYAELEAQSDSLAARLQAAGVKRGDLVGIHLERSCSMVLGLLAILKCGAAYVPMDPAFPAERLGFMVEDAHMAVILSQSSIHLGLPTSRAHVILLDEPGNLLRNFIPVESDPEDTAYVIFTSGSTGRPKGVRIPHRALVNFLHSMRREPGLAIDDVLLSCTTLSFDISGLEIFLPLSTGAETIIATREMTLDGQLLADAIVRNKVTVLQATPSTWRLLLEADWSGKGDLKILIGGEAVPRDLVNRLVPLCKEIWNVYGPTETTIWSTVARLDASENPVLIGRPIDNTQVYIVNSSMQPQPIGIAGELLIGGDGLASGYHELPELTADRFIDSPFRTGEKLYRTGDLARWTTGGELECLGRMDHQVKVRGFRIELGEIESLMEKHPAVEQAVASVRDGKLIAYFRITTQGDGTSIWQNQLDLLYQSAIDQTGNDKLDRLDSVIAGWAGAENIEEQVSQWIDTTVARIQEFQGKRIFEIGCGTGQILARLAPNTECYWAADISKVAIEALEKSHPLEHIKLFHRPADDFSDIPDSHFDTVILNSVVQYFPDASYLTRVLEGASRVLKPGGRIFVGDIQSQALLAPFHAEALNDRAPVGTTAGQLRESINRRVTQETELSLDPVWFEFLPAHIPALTHIQIQLRRGRISNETTRFHYDVVLHKDSTLGTFAVPTAIEWNNLNLEQLEAMLDESKKSIHLSGIPDARLASVLGFHRALQSAAADGSVPAIPQKPSNAVSAEELFALAENSNLKAHVRWHGDGNKGLLDAVFTARNELPVWGKSDLSDPQASYANQPHRSGTAVGELSSILRKHLAAHLPDYMIPSAFVSLEQFPLTPNGKIDRKALPAPSVAGSPEVPRKIVAARNETEAKLLDIWKQVLGNDHIGVEDDIFELGGDSILIFQITTRATRAGLVVTPAQVFRFRNVAALASNCGNTTNHPAEKSIQAVNRDAYRRKL
jgi:amino acid adenylation domain-containing protein